MSAGLFSPEEFRDNCGFGLIAHTSGDASHRLLRTAIESLTCMTHRGGIAADGKTGDGRQFKDGYICNRREIGDRSIDRFGDHSDSDFYA